MYEIETGRLIIRPFKTDDLHDIHRIKDDAFGNGDAVNDAGALAARRSWLDWSSLSHEWFAKMHQPPYGDQAIELKATGTLIGAVGYVPCLGPFGQIPELRDRPSPAAYYTTEFGLFWVIDPRCQRRGYATEAARAMIDYAFNELRLHRIIATTEYENVASQGVMQKVGMTLTRNPLPDPSWLQVVGVLENRW